MNEKKTTKVRVPIRKLVIPKSKQPFKRSSAYSGTPGGSTPIPVDMPSFN